MAAAFDDVFALPVEPAIRPHLARRPFDCLIEHRPPVARHLLAQELHRVGVVGKPGQRAAEVDVALAVLLYVRHLLDAAVGPLVQAQVAQDVR